MPHAGSCGIRFLWLAFDFHRREFITNWVYIRSLLILTFSSIPDELPSVLRCEDAEFSLPWHGGAKLVKSRHHALSRRQSPLRRPSMAASLPASLLRHGYLFHRHRLFVIGRQHLAISCAVRNTSLPLRHAQALRSLFDFTAGYLHAFLKLESGFAEPD